ncbi:hypothetical protein BDW68DRAFT_177484 [Aspergillus falconensis]
MEESYRTILPLNVLLPLPWAYRAFLPSFAFVRISTALTTASESHQHLRHTYRSNRTLTTHRQTTTHAMGGTDIQSVRNDAAPLSTTPSETIINLNSLLCSPFSLRQDEPIVSLDSLIAHPEAAVFAHHTALTNPSSASYTPTPLHLLRTLSRNPSRLSRLSRPPSYTPYPPTNFAIEYTLQLPPDLESQIQPQPLKDDSDAPTPYPPHLTTHPPAPAYTSADKRRGRKIRIFEILRGWQRSEKCLWVFIYLLMSLAVGALVFRVEEGVRTRQRPQLGPAP